MTTINRPMAKAISTDIEAALAEVAKAYGVKISTGNGRFSETTLSLKLEISTISETGEVNSKVATDFKALATMYGLEASDLGRSFMRGDLRYTITGCKPKSKKYPILATTAGGRTFKMGAASVRMLLETAAA